MTDQQPSDTNWNTADEPMTAAQWSDLMTLTSEAGEHLDPNLELTKAEAALRIEALQARMGRNNTATTPHPTPSVRQPAAHIKPAPPRTPYRDRPTDDGMYGDGGDDPSGVGDQSGPHAP